MYINKVKFCLMLLAFVFLLSSCATTTSVTKFEPEPYSPVYKVINAEKSSKRLGIRVALLKPGGEVKSDTYVKLKEKEPGKITFLGSQSDFSNNLLTSIESIMLNKGYNVVGAFENWDTMTYDEKKNVDFLVIPEFNLNDLGKVSISSSQPLTVSLATLQAGKSTCSGSVNLKGELGFTILEPLSREKIYVKKLDLGSIEPIDVNVEVQYGNSVLAETAYNELTNKCIEAWNNAASKSLEVIYNKFIEAFQNYFPEGEEAKMLNKQAKEVKSLKRF